MPKTAVTIGPFDHGRAMSLDDFDLAEVAPGYHYELGRGVIAVTEIPNPRHLVQVTASRRQFAAYDFSRPGQIHTIAGGGECKFLVAGFQSERHPDLAIYKTPPPADFSLAWATWVPEIAIEVISPSSENRDYVEKRDEYLAFGVIEYWILDEARNQLLVLRRTRGQWLEQIIQPPDIYRTRLLTGFEFNCGLVFDAARSI
jgi:hypothetical protein